MDMLLREFITENHLTVIDFAQKIGVTRDCVQKYMSGKRRPKNKDILLRILKLTDGQVTANDFYGPIKKYKHKTSANTTNGRLGQV